MKKTSFYALVAVCTSILPVSLSAQVNVAPSGLASASAATWQGQPAGNIIDGSATTQSHPLGAAGETLGFKYTVNLYASYPFETLELVNRTGCWPERLSNYRVSLHEDDEGAPGPAVWSADIRTDGSNSGDAGVDSLTADLDPTGTFVGQYIIVENLSNAAYNPQIAELRALSFQAPPANLAAPQVGPYLTAAVLAVCPPGRPGAGELRTQRPSG